MELEREIKTIRKKYIRIAKKKGISTSERANDYFFWKPILMLSIKIVNDNKFQRTFNLINFKKEIDTLQKDCCYYNEIFKRICIKKGINISSIYYFVFLTLYIILNKDIYYSKSFFIDFFEKYMNIRTFSKYNSIFLKYLNCIN